MGKMKHRIFIMAMIALFMGTLCSCEKNEQVTKNLPVLYVVNGTGYSVNVYCDNHLVTSAGAHDNSGKVVLTNVSINIPVYVEAKFYDSKGKLVTGYNWNSFYFEWNKSYKMTLTTSTSTTKLVEI